MEDRAAKLALARKKLKDHQEKKLFCGQKDDNHNKPEAFIVYDNQIVNDEKHIHQCIQNPLNSKHSEDSETIKVGSLTASVIDKSNFKQTNDIGDNQFLACDVNITEILITNKRNLELQVLDLKTKLRTMEDNHASVLAEYKICSHKLNELENELRNVNEKYIIATKDMLLKDEKLNELNSVKLSLSEENSNLTEQLEFTKTVLNAKEAENDSLHNQLFNLQNQYDVIHLQLQQLTNGLPCPPSAQANNEKSEALLQKIANLEQQLSMLKKERDQINLHYEHYVAELNEQLKSVIKKNEELTRDVENLSNRENSLIEQIGDMEIRIQNYNLNKKNFEEDSNTTTFKDMQDELKIVQDDLNRLQVQHEELQSKYAKSVAKIKELSEVKEETECNQNHENISLSKLNADMTSDKVAAQRATEQNKKLKQDLQRLEDAFVKMSKDKLELTEKISAEKYLNRELTIKLSEIDNKAKEMQIKLKAKDEEMIRLQSNYREIEKQCENLMNLERNIHSGPEAINATLEENYNTEEKNDIEGNNGVVENNNIIKVQSDKNSESDYKPLTQEDDDKNSRSLQRADAMSKLQDRFLKIMEEVADLSDEKHRLEHIILQLQNETDTICEYVALYQQQRSLLKRRDEERSSQLKIFQQECGKLKYELEELAGILKRFAEDKDLSFYFETESKSNDMKKVMNLLSNLKNNSLIDTNKKNVEFKNFYPCNCCSGKLIDV